MSPGVARQYCGALGKTANCQVLVSVNAGLRPRVLPLGWRLFLPEEWDDETRRRASAKIPDEVRHARSGGWRWTSSTSCLSGASTDGSCRPTAATATSPPSASGLEERELEYVVQVKGATSAHPADAAPITPSYQGRGRPPKARYPDKPTSLRALVLAAGSRARARRSPGARATAAR